MDERNKEIFEHFLHVMPVVNEFLSSDVAVAITDREKYLLCKQGKNINLKIEIGDPVKAGTAVARVMPLLRCCQTASRARALRGRPSGAGS